MRTYHVFILLVVVAGGCASRLPKLSARANRVSALPNIQHAESAATPVLTSDASDLTTSSPVARLVAFHQNEIEGHAEAGEVESNSVSSYFPPTTSLEDLVQHARTNNAKISAAHSLAQLHLARVPQARALDDPMLATTVFLEQLQTAAGPQDLMLSLSQKFPWFGKRDALGNIACHEAHRALAKAITVELDVVQAVRLAYWDVAFLTEALRIYADLQVQLEEIAQITRSRFDSGEKSVGLETVYQTEVTVGKLEVTVAEVRQARKAALSRLKQELHLPRGAQLELQPTLPSVADIADAEDLVAIVESCHPDITAGQHAVERDQWKVQLAEREQYPDVSLGLNWYAIGHDGLSPITNGRDAFALMAGINLPFDRVKRDAAIREARWAASQSAGALDATWDQLRADIERLHARADEHREVLAILDNDLIRKSVASFELSIEAYSVDLASFERVLDSYQTALKLKLDQSMRRTGYAQVIAQLERAVGCAVVRPTQPPEPNHDQLADEYRVSAP